MSSSTTELAASLRKPFWKQVLDGEEPQYCESYSGSDWKDAQMEAYWKALRDAADALDKAEARCKVLREALEWYCDYDNWHPEFNRSDVALEAIAAAEEVGK